MSEVMHPRYAQLLDRALTDLLSFIVDNRGRTCPVTDGGFPLIATNCIKPDQRKAAFENVRYVDDETYARWFRAHPLPGDVIFVCKGSPGRVAVVPDPVPYCIAQDMVALRADANVVDPSYLYYRLSAPDVQAKIQNMHVGTLIPHFKKGDFGQLRFSVHENLDEQRRIAGVLSALDDLIDTDRDLVDTLVEQADSVAADFRAGGDVTTFDEVCDIFGGATPKTSEPSYWNGDLHWATPSDITALRSPYLFATSRQITQAGLDACSSDLHPPGSILMTSRATIGAFALAQVPTATNQGFIVVEPRLEEDRYFLLHEMRRRVPEFMDHANGSTFMEISRRTFKSLGVEWPSEPDRRELARKLEPLHRAAIELEREVAELESRRDELLPLLLSGRVRVDEVEA